MQLAAIPYLRILTPLPEVQRAALVPDAYAYAYA